MKKYMILAMVMILCLSTTAFAAASEPSSWAENSVNELNELNQLRAEAFNDYQSDITRGQFIYLAVRLAEILTNEEIAVDSTISFSDTDDIYAIKGATAGITSGIGNGKFGYNDLLTREQLAALMIRVIELFEIEMNPASVEKFADDEAISSWAKEAIYKARNNNIISGIGGNNADPQGKASIEVALVITNRILQEKNGLIARKSDGTEITIDITSINLEEPYLDSEITKTEPLSSERIEEIKTYLEGILITYAGNDERGGVVSFELPDEFVEDFYSQKVEAIISTDVENPLTGSPGVYLDGQLFVGLDDELVTVSALENINGMHMFEVVDCYYDNNATVFVHIYMNDQPLVVKAFVMDREIPFLHPLFKQEDISYPYKLSNTSIDTEYLRKLWFYSGARVDPEVFPFVGYLSDGSELDCLLEDVIVRMPCSLKPVAGYSSTLVFIHPYTGYHIRMSGVYVPKDSILLDYGLSKTSKYRPQDNEDWMDLDQYDAIEYDPEAILFRFVHNKYIGSHVDISAQDVYPMVSYWDGSLDDDLSTLEFYSTIDSFENRAFITVGPSTYKTPESIQIELNDYVLTDWIAGQAE